jgi:predicted amidohydrolase
MHSFTFVLIGLLLGDTPPPDTFRVAAVQTFSDMGAPETNRRRLSDLVTEAAKQGAKMVVLPETSITGYLTWDLRTTWHVEGRPITRGLDGTSPAEAAEPVPGPSTKLFADLAKRLGVYVTVPLLEVDSTERHYYNSVVLVGPQGRILLHYRKLNPWPFAERSWASKGDKGRAVVDTPYGRVALLICYDINFEPPRLKELGVDHLLYPIAWVDDEGSDWFSVQLPAIARKNRLNIVGANWSVPPGVSPRWHGYGISRIISNEGKILASSRQNVGTEILYADLPRGPKGE